MRELRLLKKKKAKKKKKARRPRATSTKRPLLDVAGELARGVKYHKAGRLRKAEQIYTNILKVHPDLADCLHLKGFVAHQLGKNETAIEFITKAIQQNPGDSSYHYNLSLPFLALNKLDEAISCLQRTIQLNPELIQAHVNLGNIFQELGRFDEAISHYNKAQQLSPDDPFVHLNMGNVLQSQGKFGEAISSYEKALSLHPAFAEAYYNMGNACKAQGKIEHAVSCYKSAVRLNPGDPNAFHNMGNSFQDLNKLNDAKACYQKAIQIRPDGIEAYYHLGDVFYNQGDFQEALFWHRKALELRPDCAEAFYSMVRGMKITKHDTKEIFEIADRLKECELSEDGRICMNFALGKVYDDLGMFEEAFQHYQKANELERSKHTYHSEESSDSITKIIQTFDAVFFKHSNSWGNDSQAPIFIVGMPRSGTSLVEQIIASHPKVFGAGELDFFFKLERTLASEGRPVTYPEYMQWFDREVAFSVANAYLDSIGNLSASNGKDLYVTDKMPHNFLYLGLIYSLFPNARFIHCQRHPLDNCLSIYFQKFTQEHPYSYDLKELGLSYLDYRRLMAYWDEVLPAKILHVRYEDLVRGQEESSRQLIAYCGLEWDSQCLEFHKNTRPVFTSSNWQVRQPIYKSSMNRWENYDRFLQPLRVLLADFL